MNHMTSREQIQCLTSHRSQLGKQVKTEFQTEVNFINISGTHFSYKHCFGSFFYVHVTREKLLKQRSYEKFVRKMLMKLTPVRNPFFISLNQSCKMLLAPTFCGPYTFVAFSNRVVRLKKF
jgi:hypothetical protein